MLPQYGAHPRLPPQEHLSGWKHICHFLFHSSSDDRSFCRSTASWIFLMLRNSRQSFAKSLALEDVASDQCHWLQSPANFWGTLSIVPSWTTSIATRSFVMSSMDSESNDLANPSYLLPLMTYQLVQIKGPTKRQINIIKHKVIDRRRRRRYKGKALSFPLPFSSVLLLSLQL
jgi:hypothetical protein